ncbi:hypothetical protein D0Z00_003753 [Geotrichum galactomycetum]|uniref:Uncharacterized protein n=1 Tax=Geotrichum galactomycetum TaxID=27317 RepID=A0ACB6V0E8_9ASCO|nr:hypothetical protein D0Z00_003753 [Geotrichum candidum]
MSFQFPTDYKFVLASLALIPAFSTYLGITVIKARKTGKVELPLLFASEADAAADPAKYKFNCTQKSAMNFQEHMPGFVVGALISGVSFPRATAIAVLSWLSGRYLYHQGYSSGDPKKRSRGFHGSLTHLVVTLGALYSAYCLIF